MEENINIFISHAPKDKQPYCEELKNHLAELQRGGFIDVWCDCEIPPGDERQCKIEEHLNGARIILLLISPDYLASDYCYNTEMRRALERHRMRVAQVIPVILRPVDWHEAPFAHLQCLPRDARPVTESDNREAALRDIAQGIREVVQMLTSDKKTRRLPETPQQAVEELRAVTGPSVVFLPSRDTPAPGPTSAPSPEPQPARGSTPLRPRKRKVLIVAMVCAILLVLVFFVKPIISPSPTGIGVTQAPDGEWIGLSDGTFAFDTNRDDGHTKEEAADALRARDINSALSYWQSATSVDTNDAEARIYQEDQRVLASGRPYITFVVVTMLTGDSNSVGIGRDDLQGAYVAQNGSNMSCGLAHCTQVRLLVANVGRRSTFASQVAQQIVQAAQADKTIMGVMGWPVSSGSTIDAIKMLGNAHLPMVSPTASNDGLTANSPYIFRVAPSNDEQARVGAQYAEHVLHAKRVALFIDTDDPYSNNLGNDFKQHFIADGNRIVYEGLYTVGYPEGMYDYLHAALTVNPDLIYVAGYAGDASTIMKELKALTAAALPVMGGNAFYGLGGYPSGVFTGFNHFYFTAFAYPDEWGALHQPAPPFLASQYANAFDPERNHKDSPYGYIRPDGDAMLSYDALEILLYGSQAALTGGKTSPQPDDLRQALATVTCSHPLQGVSGQICLGPTGDPIDKAVVVLKVAPGGYIELAEQRWLWGTLLPTKSIAVASSH